MKEASQLNKKANKINLQRTSKIRNIVTDKMELTKERGITLIALVITIVILIILATVAISVVFGEGGLIDRAQEGKDLYKQAQTQEQQELLNTEAHLNELLAGTGGSTPEPEPPKPELPTIEEAKPNPNEDGPKFEDTTTITDDLDNEVTIPGGFHIDKDSGTKVEEGIVIEDDVGNQFVWIPVGEYNVTEEIEKITEPDAQNGKLINELSRRQWADENVVAEPTLVNGDDSIDSYCYGEGDSRSVAKDQIDAFKTSSTTRKGFYIARYEAGTEAERTAKTDPLTMPLVQANKYPYVYVTRDEAKQQAEAMYNANTFVTSELISSYAWDTALNFICQTNKEGYLLATTTDRIYGNIGTNSRTKTGEYEGDKYSNIHDILGNRVEWTTEYFSVTDNGNSLPCVTRGGFYDVSNFYAATRYYRNTSYSYTHSSFRLQLYVNPES